MALQYKDFSRFFDIRVKRMARRHAWYALPCPRILDLGSGTGKRLKEFAEFGCAAVGVDVGPTQEHLDIPAINAELGRQAITFIQKNLTQLTENDLGKGGFSAVALENLIHYLPDEKETLENLFRLVKKVAVPGAYAVLKYQWRSDPGKLYYPRGYDHHPARICFLLQSFGYTGLIFEKDSAHCRIFAKIPGETPPLPVALHLRTRIHDRWLQMRCDFNLANG